MTKAEIIAELRRSAIEDRDPWNECKHGAMDVAAGYSDAPLMQHWCGGNLVRTFFLLVASSLETQ